MTTIMSDSLRYKIVLWIVWVQIALLPIWLCMEYMVDRHHEWRWGLDTWIFIAGFILGVLALPFGKGIDKPRFLKWWLRIDFTFTMILMLPILFICSAFVPATIAEDGEYIIYHIDGFAANRSAYLARKSGLLMETIFDLSPYEGGRLTENCYRFDNEKGVFYGAETYAVRQNGSRIWVVPIHDEKYANNKEYVYRVIDSLYYAHGEWIDNDEATFVMPDGFTRIDYTHGDILLSDSISCKISYVNGDSVDVYFYYPVRGNVRLPADSIPPMSPTGAHKLIKQLKGGKP